MGDITCGGGSYLSLVLLLEFRDHVLVPLSLLVFAPLCELIVVVYL